MPRVAKDKEKEKKETNIVEKKEAPKAKVKSASIKVTSKSTKKVSSAKATAKSTVKAKKASTSTNKPVVKKEVAKKTTSKKEPVKKETVKKETAKKSKAVEKKENVDKKTTTAKKTTTKKATTSKETTTKRAATKRNKKSVEIVEYYDLPFRYNQTTVKVLAQTPTNLFIYWDISDNDRDRFTKQYGENFFELTKPVLIITNETKNYTFEIDINDFANSWYLHVDDSNCKYKIELGRRPKSNEISIENNYIYIDSSNEIEAPNNHILFDELKHSVFFKDVKSNNIIEKDISSMSFITRIGKLYNIYDLYKKMYKDELIGNEFGLTTLSSSPSSSNFI